MHGANMKTCSTVHYDELWRPVDCKGQFCRFALLDSIIWLPYHIDLFLLILVHAHISVHCLILSVVACIR